MHSDNHFALPNPSISSSWSSMLCNILRYPPSSRTPQASIHTRPRRCSGNIWKHFTSLSIYHDLASISTIYCDNASMMTTLRRFVRLEHIGLSGVILYEIRMCSPCPAFKGDGIDIEGCLTMQDVFGNHPVSEVGADHSMGLDDLLDAVGAKMVHFPSYACTSFIVGQVMNAYLTNRHELTPIPAPSGFSILGSESESESAICTAASFTSQSGRSSDSSMSIDGTPIQVFPSGFHLDNLQKAFSLTDDDPHLALCIPGSSLDLSGVILNDASKSSDSDEEAGDSGDSTIDSLGLCTPPRLSHGLILPEEWNAASKDSPDFFPAPLLHLTEENELTSFIDFTGSFFEDIDSAI